jgi:hypothetical protein
MAELLMKEEALLLLPSLAKKYGINEAIILQQLHSLLEKSSNVIEGKKWIYNTYKDWKVYFPFLSESTIKRTILSLQKEGVVITNNFNPYKMDKTKWYTIDYEVIQKTFGK